MEIDGFHSTLAWRLQADNWTNLGGTLIYKDYEGISMLYATYDLHRVKSEDTAGHRKWISQIAILDELASTIFIWHLFSLATAGKSTMGSLVYSCHYRNCNCNYPCSPLQSLKIVGKRAGAIHLFPLNAEQVTVIFHHTGRHTYQHKRVWCDGLSCRACWGHLVLTNFGWHLLFPRQNQFLSFFNVDELKRIINLKSKLRVLWFCWKNAVRSALSKKIISLRVLVSGWAVFILMILYSNEQHRTDSSPLFFVSLLFSFLLFFTLPFLHLSTINSLHMDI